MEFRAASSRSRSFECFHPRCQSLWNVRFPFNVTSKDKQRIVKKKYVRAKRSFTFSLSLKAPLTAFGHIWQDVPSSRCPSSSAVFRLLRGPYFPVMESFSLPWDDALGNKRKSIHTRWMVNFQRWWRSNILFHHRQWSYRDNSEWISTSCPQQTPPGRRGESTECFFMCVMTQSLESQTEVAIFPNGWHICQEMGNNEQRLVKAPPTFPWQPLLSHSSGLNISIIHA